MNDPQKKYCLRMVSKTNLREGLNQFNCTKLGSGLRLYDGSDVKL